MLQSSMTSDLAKLKAKRDSMKVLREYSMMKLPVICVLEMLANNASCAGRSAKGEERRGDLHLHYPVMNSCGDRLVDPLPQEEGRSMTGEWALMRHLRASLVALSHLIARAATPPTESSKSVSQVIYLAWNPLRSIIPCSLFSVPCR